MAGLLCASSWPLLSMPAREGHLREQKRCFICPHSVRHTAGEAGSVLGSPAIKWKASNASRWEPEIALTKCECFQRTTPSRYTCFGSSHLKEIAAPTDCASCKNYETTASIAYTNIHTTRSYRVALHLCCVFCCYRGSRATGVFSTRPLHPPMSSLVPASSQPVGTMQRSPPTGPAF